MTALFEDHAKLAAGDYGYAQHRTSPRMPVVVLGHPTSDARYVRVRELGPRAAPLPKVIDRDQMDVQILGTFTSREGWTAPVVGAETITSRADAATLGDERIVIVNLREQTVTGYYGAAVVYTDDRPTAKRLRAAQEAVDAAQRDGAPRQPTRQEARAMLNAAIGAGV